MAVIESSAVRMVSAGLHSLEHIEADGACLRGDVRVPDLRVEFHLGRVVRIVTGNLDVNDEDAARVGSAFWALQLPLPMGEVGAVDGVRRHGRFLGERLDVLKLLLKPLHLPGAHRAGGRHRFRLGLRRRASPAVGRKGAAPPSARSARGL